MGVIVQKFDSGNWRRVSRECCETHDVVIIAPGEVFIDFESRSKEHCGQKEEPDKAPGKIDFQIAVMR